MSMWLFTCSYKKIMGVIKMNKAKLLKNPMMRDAEFKNPVGDALA